MGKYLTGDFEKALLQKGFQLHKTHHNMFLFYRNGKKTHIRTRTSHSEKNFDDYMLNQRKKQLKLKKKDQILDFINCPMSGKDYVDFLVSIKEIDPEEET